ncbi:AAA family ATPase [Planomonospora sp. ID67723]|uniref:AAA family ATPase n=1 Tax=Planomonospora sp. ID67723 TaxID=2738134 RepID=UPI0018C3A171|nr:AAA family ATPase [Planomonospora sp. ID67723]MBG0826330.1 AAA family ATPase [Planomonospora sp. ID67723]
MRDPDLFMQLVAVDEDTAPRGDFYPFALPVVKALRQRGGIVLRTPVTFLAGDNGTGKSTLIEAIAVAAGLNPEGGSGDFDFATRASESDLGRHLRLAWSTVPGNRPAFAFFLRAETYYNVATEMERHLGHLTYNGHSPHERSHGQSFLDVVLGRFEPRGLYLMDEPESALSAGGQLTLLARIMELTAQGSQFIVATHSPILMALPGADIYDVTDMQRIGYTDTDSYQITRGFLDAPERYLRHLRPQP